MSSPDLREEGADLLSRRPEFAATLAPYGDLVERWARWGAGRARGPRWTAAECRERWARGVPLVAAAPPAIRADQIEDLLAAAMDHLAALGDGVLPGLQRLAQAWDAGRLGPAALLPAPGRIGSPAPAPLPRPPPRAP